MNRSWIGEQFAPGEGEFYYADHIVHSHFAETILYEYTSHDVHVHVYDMIDADMSFFSSIDDVWEGRYEL